MLKKVCEQEWLLTERFHTIPTSSVPYINLSIYMYMYAELVAIEYIL